MANALTAFTPEYWSRRTQILLRKLLVGRSIASTEERATLRDGDKVHRPYHSDPYVVDYTKGTDVTIQDITTTDESLDVDQSKVVPVYIDDVDIIQNKYSTANKLIDRSAHMLGREIDHKILQQVASASLDIDDGDIGGTSGNPISLSTSNVNNVFGTTFAELAGNNVEMNSAPFLVIDPQIANTIMQGNIANGFNVADATLKNGFLGQYLGYKVFQSNALLSTVSLGIATNPSEGDTVIINGVTFTFNATPSGAGSVDIGGTAAVSVDNLVAAINDTGTAGTTYIQLSDANRAKLKNNQVTATDATTSITLTAAGRMVLSETFTDTTDAFGTQTVKCMAGRVGAIDLVMQREPTVQMKDEPKKLGKNYLTHALYGVKMFNEGAERTVEVNIAV